MDRRRSLGVEELGDYFSVRPSGVDGDSLRDTGGVGGDAHLVVRCGGDLGHVGSGALGSAALRLFNGGALGVEGRLEARSEEHTSELQSLMRISYAVFCLKKK